MLVIRAICLLKMDNIFFRSFTRKVNPGVRRRLQISNDQEELSSDDLDYEADFEMLNLTHKQHLEEMEQLREKHQFDIVKQKYFKVKLPNFLMWTDKEQIRFLHSKDPEKWTVTKLSEGFPALPEVIKKILKSNWKSGDIEKIRKHDVSVKNNWEKFKNNEFHDLPQNLTTHLQKFSMRDLSHYDYEKSTNQNNIEVVIPQNKCSEFSDIIKSYENIKVKQEPEIKSNDDKKNRRDKNSMGKFMDKPITEDTFIDGDIKNKHLMTLDTLKKDVERKLQSGKDLSPVDRTIIQKNEVVENSKTPIPETSLDLTKYNSGNYMILNEKKQRHYDHLVYPQQITIPKEILKKGYTYKLNDCFYDSNGEFLYRVPGMF